MSATEAELRAAQKLVQRIRPLLAHRPSQTQGAVLADLLAIWLAGHIVQGDPAETAKLREDMLATHLEFVRLLIPVNSRAIHGDT